MEANSKNFSILVENEEQFNRVWNYVRWYHPMIAEVDYNEAKPIGIKVDLEKYTENGYFTSLVKFAKHNEPKESITWEQFLEYEKETQKAEMKEQKSDRAELLKQQQNVEAPIDVKNEIRSTLKTLNYFISLIPEDEALNVTFSSDGDDRTIYFDNLTKFTSVKSIFGGEELL